MAQTLQITDGTTTISLLNAAGLSVARDGHTAQWPDARTEATSGLLGEGSLLQFSGDENIIENYTLNLFGSSHDNVATTLQNLAALRRNAARWSRARWKASPVWLVEQTATETGTRYSQVYQIELPDAASIHSYLFNTAKTLTALNLLVERAPYWQSVVPQTLPAAATFSQDEAGSRTMVYVPNCRETAAITHIFTYDSSLTTFSANLVTSTDYDLFPNPVGNGDILYVGSTDGIFRNIVFDLSILRTGTAAIAVEIFVGSWQSFDGDDSTNKLKGDTVNTGAYALRNYDVNVTNDWTTTAINGVTAYWMRYRITTLATMPAIPHQGTTKIYNARSPWITFGGPGDTAVKGDVDALLRLFLTTRGPDSALGVAVMQVIVGMKTRGLTNFISRLNFGGANPAGWSVAAGTDTASSVDVHSPSGNNLTCTFATNITLVARGTISNSTTATCADFAGQYRVFLNCRQVGGAAGDVSVQLEVTINGLPAATVGGRWQSALVALQTTRATDVETAEIVDLGILNLPFLQDEFALAADQNSILTALDFRLYASATGATPDLEMLDLVLIPIDEWYVSAEAPRLEGGVAIGIYRDNALVVDGGVIGSGAQLVTDWTDPESAGLQWYLASPAPRIPPDTVVDLHFLLTDGIATASIMRAGQGLLLNVYAIPRWLALRGSE